MNKYLKGIAPAAAIVFSAAVANASTIDIRDAADTFSFASLTYSGLDSDVVGFFDTLQNPTKAQRYLSGNNDYESDLVEMLGNFPVDSVDLGGTEALLTGLTFVVPGSTYFTVKFGTSLAVGLNTSLSDITITFGIDANCKVNYRLANPGASNGVINSACGDLSHSKQIADWRDDPGAGLGPVPLPATLPLLAAALGLGGIALRRRA